MRLIAALLALACIVVAIVNEGVRVKYGFISDRHFSLFWIIWALVLTGMGIAVGILLRDILGP